MEPITYGFMVTVAGASVMGVAVGALGGAGAWRARIHIALGALLTACVYVLLLIADHHGRLFWLRAELVWGAPLLAMGYLVSWLAARWVAAHTRLGRTWAALVSFCVALVVGLSYMLLFRIDMRAPIRWAWAIDAGLVVLLIWRRVKRRAIP
ncbi:MAG TPA: hypothetical protein VFX78_01085 [Candidatus Eisenbacteria bacterium]|nr:hypothetical protein [Candidatus Eisenbacteria bacterium]